MGRTSGGGDRLTAARSPGRADVAHSDDERIRYWLHEERRRLLAAVAGLAEEQSRQPLASGGWSVHEVLAHRLFWERQEVEALGQHLLGQRVELLDFPSKRLDAANAAAVRTMRGMTTADVLRDLARTRAALLDLVRRLPDADLNAPGNDARTLLGVALTHDREHAAQIRVWRESAAPPSGPR